MSLRFLALFSRPSLPTLLGRWCTPSYSKTCDQFLKADLASLDNGTHVVKAKSVQPLPFPEVYCAERLLAERFGN